jgi:hypothetical protein
MRRLYAVLLAVLLAAGLAGFRDPARALGQGSWSISVPEYEFGQQATFRATFEPADALQEAIFFLQIEGDSRAYAATIPAPGEAVYQLDLSQQHLRAFSRSLYWFEATLANGEKVDSEKYQFDYIDNRFEWQTRSADPFTVHWYEGDTHFAQSIVDIAKAGLERVNSLVTLPEAEKIDIYAYSSASDMQVALDLSEQKWVAGHADPDLGVMVVWLPTGPDQRLIMEQRIPHELMHIRLYQDVGPAYDNLPTWLNEGLASVAELYPNPDYLVLLQSASQKKTLLAIASLCHGFPRDASSTLLAYAQSTSFTRYLQQQYGTSSLDRLVEAYADGLTCERGVQSVFGRSSAQLEQEWRTATFGENAVANAFSNLLPWLVLAGLALATPLGLMLRNWRKRPAAEPAK